MLYGRSERRARQENAGLDPQSNPEHGVLHASSRLVMGLSVALSGSIRHKSAHGVGDPVMIEGDYS